MENETYIIIVPASGKVDCVPFDTTNPTGQLSSVIGKQIRHLSVSGTHVPGFKRTAGFDLHFRDAGDTEGLPVNAVLSEYARLGGCMEQKLKRGERIFGDGVFCGHDAEGDTVGLSVHDRDRFLKMFRQMADAITPEAVRKALGLR